VVARPSSRLHVVADVGPPCPPELPAHAHADCLSFELCVDGRRVAIDTGTSTYSATPRRAYERSTRAHNTVEIDGADQTEVWGAFRAARRARARLDRTTDDGRTIVIAAEHDGYRRLRRPVNHRRTWRLLPNCVEIRDELSGASRHHAVARLHLAPGLEAVQRQDGSVRAGPLVVTSPSQGVDIVEAGTIPDGWVANGFGVRQPAGCLVINAEGDVPLTITTVLATYDAGSGRYSPF
jgi:uncharacterized heparinase superfamily protein